MNRKFEEIINELKALPIYTMSLGSKELFHSNFWAWLMEQPESKILVNLFFDEIDISKGIYVGREKGNRDITVWDNEGNAYVIENKIKSFPEKWQLEKYEADTTKFVRGIITGVKEPPFELKGTKWTFISYETIAKYLKDNILPKITNLDLKNVLEQYIKMIIDINEIIEQCFKQTEGFYDPWPTDKYKLLEEVRLHDVYQKAKADDLVKRVFEEAKKNFKVDGFEINIGRGYHNVKPTLSFHILPLREKYGDKSWDKFLEIQIEGYQFRIFYRCSNKSLQEVFNDGVKIGWFEEGYDKKLNNKIRNYISSMSIPYCQYSKKYVYQYFDLWNKDNKQDLLSYDNISKLLIAELKRAQDILEKNKNKFTPPYGE